MTSESPLFTPLKVGSLQLDHRIVMAPLTRMRAPGHQVTDIHSKYYAQRGSAPGTLLIAEGTFISEAAGGYPNAPGIFTKEHVAGWKKVASSVHDKKSFLFVQLWALGRAATPEVLKSRGLPFVSASDVKENPEDESAPAPRPLTKEEIKQYVADYVQAAKNAIDAGADGVEIHSANGYLLDQFLHANTNHRTDEYGGSIENRARFTLEVVDAIVEAIGAERTGIRLSPWGIFGGMDGGVSPIPQFSYVVSELQRRANEGKQLAYVHAVEPRLVLENLSENGKEWVEFKRARHSNNFIRDIWTGVFIVAGGIDLKLAKELTEKDDKLLIGIGRDFIATPDLVKRWKQGIKLNPRDRTTYYTPGEVGYTDLPFAEEVAASA